MLQVSLNNIEKELVNRKRSVSTKSEPITPILLLCHQSGETRDDCTHHNPQPILTDKHAQSSNPSLRKVGLETATLEGAVGFAPVISIERPPDSWADGVVIDHIVLTTRAGLELEFVIGREISKVFDLQMVSVSHLRVGGLLVIAVTGSSATEDTRVGISR